MRRGASVADTGMWVGGGQDTLGVAWLLGRPRCVVPQV
jgi:hypothetical protein